MSTSKEIEFTGPGGIKMFAKTWTPASAPVAQVVFVHGFVEHVRRYDHVFPRFADEGIAVLGFDQRGFGQTAAYTKSQGETSWPQALGDISFVIEQASTLHPGVPLYIFGHSMGGGLSLAFATRTPPSAGLEKIKGIIASAPLLRQAKGVKASPMLVKAGSLLGKLSGKLTLSAPVKAEDVCRDPEVQKAYAADPLCLQQGTFRGVSDMLLGGDALMTKDYKNLPANLPVLIVHGSGDKVTDHDASVEFVEKAKKEGKSIEFQSFEGLYHEMHNEPADEKWKPVDAVVSWIKSKL